MDITTVVYIKNGLIKLNTHKIVVRRFTGLEKSGYVDTPYYVDANENGIIDVESYVSKHQLMEIVSKEELDTTGYEWLEGIEIQTDDPQTEVPKIYSYGSLEAYEASLEESADAYMTDLDYRLSMLELGLTE